MPDHIATLVDRATTAPPRTKRAVYIVMMMVMHLSCTPHAPVLRARIIEWRENPSPQPRDRIISHSDMKRYREL